jgi:hypothetical protein
MVSVACGQGISRDPGQPAATQPAPLGYPSALQVTRGCKSSSGSVPVPVQVNDYYQATGFANFS